MRINTLADVRKVLEHLGRNLEPLDPPAWILDPDMEFIEPVGLDGFFLPDTNQLVFDLSGHLAMQWLCRKTKVQQPDVLLETPEGGQPFNTLRELQSILTAMAFRTDGRAPSAWLAWGEHLVQCEFELSKRLARLEVKIRPDFLGAILLQLRAGCRGYVRVDPHHH